MKLISPFEVGGKIVTLINEAKEKIVIVSPYNDLTYWNNFRRALAKALDRQVEVEYYHR